MRVNRYEKRRALVSYSGSTEIPERVDNQIIRESRMIHQFNACFFKGFPAPRSTNLPDYWIAIGFGVCWLRAFTVSCDRNSANSIHVRAHDINR